MTTQLHGYDFKPHYHTVGKFKCHYIEEGKGDPVVMLHGNPTWSYYFRNLAKTISKNHRVIVPDHIGCGFSDKPSPEDYDYTLDQRANDLEDLLDHLGIKEKITLVLHDWGGMIGMTYATRHPERIKRLVLTNTGAFHLPKEKSFPKVIAVSKNKAVGKFLVQGFNFFAKSATTLGMSKNKMTDEIKAGYLAPYGNWSDRTAVYQFIKDIPLKKGDRCYDLVSDVASKISAFKNIPTLIVWGEKDFVFDHHFLAQWQKYLPNAEVHIMKNAGHYVLEDAGEEANEIIDYFLQNNEIN